MKINTEEMKKYASLSDEELWSKIKEVALEKGYSLQKPPSHEDLEKVRSVLRGDVKFSLTEASRLIKKYRKENGI